MYCSSTSILYYCSMRIISGSHTNDTQSQAAFESKMFALLSLAKSKWRTPYNSHNSFQKASVVDEAHSSVFWWELAWLLEWSEQSTNQYDCSRLLLKRHTRACVQHDCCSSAKGCTQKVSWHGSGQQHGCPVISVSPSIVWLKEKPVWLMTMAEMLMWILRLHLLWLFKIKYFE